MRRFVDTLMRYRAVRFVVEATQGFFADDVPRMAAAMSYFMLLAVAPLVLLANVFFNVLGLLTGHAPDAAAAQSAAAAAQNGYQQAAAWAGSYAPWLVAGLVLVGALSVFAQFVQSVNDIWKTSNADNAIRSYLRRRGVALTLLGVTALAFLIAIVVAAVVAIVVALGLAYAQAVGISVPDIARSALARAALVFVAAAVLFAVAFALAPDRRVRWRDALPSALLTGAFFVVGTQVLTIYLGTTQRFVVFGAAQFFVALTVWIYYSAMVVLWGVELSRVMVLDAEERRGESS